ncbi:Co2+/Mg2+ efflux protein ApaG [Thalassotalea sp. PS06]|uniref:Co2+/Mg2+ efflux protein ApaG n=1 Tax=Thalassotalea sp. PS06 TaxID=2594005 RepID=UPI001162DE61|nr:Co2+/Mg2+ efflux protein ApaG [Thalassotalea sp. PS06]QDP02224.1 Co2+/Mg2+ efflux protein ApaG [Thalassotalea sp. PS06]
MNTLSSQDNSQVDINAQVHFIEEQSDQYNERFVFSYTITIENRSEETLQLLARSWLITDANGNKVSVEGDGVVGQQPVIAAGQSYQYTSGSIIKTPLGTMEGFYTLKDLSGNEHKVQIPVFRLAVPNILN